MEKTPLKFLYYYAKNFRWSLFFIFITILITSISSRVFPLYLAKIYDTVSGKINTSSYWEDIYFFIILASFWGLMRALFHSATMFIESKVFPKMYTLTTRDAFDYANKHSIAFFSEEMSGNISNKVNQLSDRTVQFFEMSSHVISVILAVGVSYIMLWSVSFSFIIPVTLWFIAMIILGGYFGKIRHKNAKELGQVESLTNGQIVDSISNYSEIKSFANFKFERLNLSKQLKKLRKVETKERLVRVLIFSIQALIVVSSLVAFLFFTTYLLKEQKIDTVDFIFSVTLFSMLSWAIFEVTGLTHRMSHIFGRLEAALETLSIDPEIQDKPKAKKLEIKKASITFENVDFSYKNYNSLFKDLNIVIKPGEKVGLVGHSGSGKSTFIKLIARYYDVESGVIKINDIDIRDVTQDSLRKNISTIPQDINLFNRTLLENIRYGKTNASDEEVYKAAKKAFADEFIKEFPNGYKTKVGERGVVLSGGERQRIAIARAILKDASVLIFDEATSALDSKSEKHIQSSMKTLMKNKTVIAIAHRLSTLREMDRILVFRKGKIVEQGSHLALLRKKGIYHRLYNMQSDGLIGGLEDETEQDKGL